MLNDKLANEVLKSEGVGPRNAVSEEEDFERTSLQWLRGWLLEQDASKHQGVCVFLFHPDRKPESILAQGVLRQCFRDSKPDELAGYAYACTTVLKSVHRQALPASLLELPDLLNWMNKNNLNDCHAVIFLPSRRRVFIKSRDIAADIDELLFFDLPEEKQKDVFDFSQLGAVLEMFYKQGVETPGGVCRVWKDEKKRILNEKPEDLIQRSLYFCLFLLINVTGQGQALTEVTNLRGREDVEIIRFNETTQKYEIAIIELKVLFPTYSAQKNQDWALQGIQQVVDYAKSRENVVSRHAVCYDGRKKDEAMPEFFQKATDEGVEGWRFFMETSNVKRVITGFKQ